MKDDLVFQICVIGLGLLPVALALIVLFMR